jgi:hypothetical protein
MTANATATTAGEVTTAGVAAAGDLGEDNRKQDGEEDSEEDSEEEEDVQEKDAEEDKTQAQRITQK